MTASRKFWVVSPNVQDKNSTVGLWRQASVKWGAAFMGYKPDDLKHKRIGFKFAHEVKPKDIILIARRYRGRPEVVGCGIVKGPFKTRLQGFKPPHRFGSLRLLRPFKPLSAAPPKPPLWEALVQSTALARLHPRRNPNHKLICKWMERKLEAPEQRPTSDRKKARPGADLVKSAPLRLGNELEYQIRTRQKAIRAERIETQLLNRYRAWLAEQDRKLETVTNKGLRCDAFEKERGNLIEAKCSAGREFIRMAVGQLFDYSYVGRRYFGKPSMAILLPERPDSKSFEWLSELHISVIWREKGTFLDNANGQFT